MLRLLFSLHPLYHGHAYQNRIVITLPVAVSVPVPMTVAAPVCVQLSISAKVPGAGTRVDPALVDLDDSVSGVQISIAVPVMGIVARVIPDIVALIPCPTAFPPLSFYCCYFQSCVGVVIHYSCRCMKGHACR